MTLTPLGTRASLCPPGLDAPYSLLGLGVQFLSLFCTYFRAQEGLAQEASFLVLLQGQRWPGPSFFLFCLPPRSELIQLVAVTQKTAERSYREHIEQQIQTYQRR